jgi:uncharacterized protein (DUF486 family)
MHRIFLTILLLTLSNIFMTTAWYGHLKFFGQDRRGWALLGIVLISWLIALPEYLLQVPANRMGYNKFGGPFTTPQLKVIQEAITLAVFVAFSIFVLKDRFKATDIIAFLLIFAGVAVSMMGREAVPS